MRPAQRFLIICVSCLVSAIFAVATLTITVDPYAVWGTPRIRGFNAIKPDIYTHAALAKLAQGRRLMPKSIILGNSRLDVGLNPESQLWPSAMRPVFNLAIPGIGPGSNLINLERLFEGRPTPHLVVMGIDFPDFLVDRRRTTTPVLVAPKQGSLVKIHNFMSTTLSDSALIDAIDTIRAQSEPYAPNMTAHGLDTMREYQAFVRREGHYNLFYQRDLENMRMQLRGGKSVTDPDGRPSETFEELRAVIDWCQLHRITLHLVIYPYHADLLNSFYLTRLWPAFEKWKRIFCQHGIKRKKL